MQELLGPVNKRIVGQAIEALKQADGARSGRPDGGSPGILRPLCHACLPRRAGGPGVAPRSGYEPLKPHIFGGKGVGSQGDGTAQFLARSEADQQAVIEILQRDLGLPALKLTLRPSLKVRRAVIPAAGFGTRLFPATKATKKELFPIIDRDGIAKPAILLIVEEALEAGIEEIIIIVQENDLEGFPLVFQEPDHDREFQQAAAQLSGLFPAHPGYGPACHLCLTDRPRRLWPCHLLHA